MCTLAKIIRNNTCDQLEAVSIGTVGSIYAQDFTGKFPIKFHLKLCLYCYDEGMVGYSSLGVCKIGWDQKALVLVLAYASISTDVASFSCLLICPSETDLLTLRMS